MKAIRLRHKRASRPLAAGEPCQLAIIASLSIYQGSCWLGSFASARGSRLQGLRLNQRGDSVEQLNAPLGVRRHMRSLTRLSASSRGWRSRGRACYLRSGCSFAPIDTASDHLCGRCRQVRDARRSMSDLHPGAGRSAPILLWLFCQHQDWHIMIMMLPATQKMTPVDYLVINGGGGLGGSAPLGAGRVLH